MKKYDYLRAFTSLFCQKLVLPLKMDKINAHMHGFKFEIPNLIQQMVITEKVCIFKPNLWEVLISTKNKPDKSKKKKVMGDRGRFIR